MEDSKTECRRFKISGEINLILIITIYSQLRSLGISNQHLIKGFLQNIFQTILLKHHRTIRFQTIIKAVCTEAPLIILLVIRPDRHLFTPGILLLLLVQCENRLLRIILVHLHIVFQILVGGGGGQQEFIRFPLIINAVIQHPPPIGAGIIYTYRLHLSCLRVILSVREGALVDIIIIECILQFHCRIDQPIQFKTSAGRLLLICLRIGIFVHEKTVIPVVVTAKGNTDMLAQFSIMGRFDLGSTIVTCRHRKLCSLIIEG